MVITRGSNTFIRRSYQHNESHKENDTCYSGVVTEARNISGVRLCYGNFIDFFFPKLHTVKSFLSPYNVAFLTFSYCKSVEFTTGDAAGASSLDEITERNSLTSVCAATPLISIYMPTWNRETLAIRAIESIVAQDYSHWELIVIDDCSPSYDKLSHYVETLNDPRVKFIRNEYNSGACAVRNQAIRLAKGALITGIDDDDEWLPNRLSAFIDHQSMLKKHAFLYADDYICESKQYSNLAELRLYPKPEYNEKLFDKKNIVGNQIFTLTSRLQDGLFDTHLLAAQDYDAFYRLAKKYGPPLKVQKATQILYVNHGEARITGSHKKFSGYLNFYRKHKGTFDKSSKKYQLFTLYYIRNKPMGMRTLLRLMTLRNARRYAMLYTSFKNKKF